MTDWPDAPVRLFGKQGTYIVTSGTYLKQHYFQGSDRLHILQDNLLALSELYGWELLAWAVLSNHYHFIAISPEDPSTLQPFIHHFHTVTATAVNKLDETWERIIWHKYSNTRLKHRKSYLAQLHYIHQNPVHHGLVSASSRYPWCSAGWFEQTADEAFAQEVAGCNGHKTNIYDDFT